MLSKEEIENNIKEKDSNTVETEKIIIEIPKNTNFLSLVCFFTDKDGFNANNQILGIKPIKERKEYIEQLESKANKYDSLVKKIKDKIEEVGTTIDKQVSNNISITAEEFYSNNAIYNFGKELLKEVEDE